MMELKNQVCSLEAAKKLKEFGVKQESLFYHVIDNEHKIEKICCADNNLFLLEPNKREALSYDGLIGLIGSYSIWAHEIYSAFTVSELGSMLPHQIEFKTTIYKSLITNEMGSVSIEFDNQLIMSETEVDARAGMLIHLIENRLMEVPK